MDFKTWLDKHIFSASEIESYLLCPFRFYAQSYLKLAPETRWEVEMTPAETGLILHRILERFLKEHKKEEGQEGLTSGILDLMEREVANFQTSRPHLSQVLLDRHKKRISRTLLSFLEDYLHEGDKQKTLKPLHLEWSFGSDTSPLEIKGTNGKPIKIRGRVDRIDVDHAQKRFLVIDYKTGSKKITGNEIRSGEALQLPLYILAVKKLLLKDYEPMGGLYYQLSDMTMANGILHSERLPDFLELHPRSSSLVPDSEWNMIFSRVEDKVRHVVSQITEGRFASGTKPCEPYCPYQDICRIRGEPVLIV